MYYTLLKYIKTGTKFKYNCQLQVCSVPRSVQICRSVGFHNENVHLLTLVLLQILMLVKQIISVVLNTLESFTPSSASVEASGYSELTDC
jgi:hypothetical protein